VSSSLTQSVSLTHSRLRGSESFLKSSASQEIPRLLWNGEVHDRFHKIPPLVYILSLKNPVHITSLYFKIKCNIFTSPRSHTERHGRMANTPASYSGGPGFKSLPRQPAILIEVFRGFR
jgi:hypothetical protein